ncbi:MAG: 4-hydroxy-tetrahydrodipicolinate synthase [Chloroflexota bacterium]|nr:4-hydroxy-tetrahydrodipicolinate synthase [Chloroflexota bacterium]
MTRAKLGRVLTAMVTPFDREGAVDYEQTKRLAYALIESGSDGIVVAGTTGESSTLSTEEKLRLFTVVKEVVGDRGAVIAGTGGNNTFQSVQLTKEAARISVDGILSVVPYYNKPTQEGLFRHFCTIAEATDLPLLLYNIPSRSIISLSLDTTIKLSQVLNIVGIKEASGNFDQIAQIIRGTEEGFLVYSGEDSHTLPILSIGGYGVISVVSHLVGQQLSQMIQNYLNGDVASAAQTHRRLLPLMKSMFVVTNPAPVKYALGLAGFPVGTPRLPLVEPDEVSKASIESTLNEYQFDLKVESWLQ